MTRRKRNAPRRVALLWGVISEVWAGGALLTLLMSRTARHDAYFGAKGSVAVLAASILVITSTLITVSLSRYMSKIIRRPLGVSGFLGAAALAAMGLGNLTSNLTLLLLPTAVGMYILATFTIKENSPQRH